MPPFGIVTEVAQGLRPCPAQHQLRWACTAAAAVAVTALLGALLNHPLLASCVPASVPMAPASALGVLILVAVIHPGLPWNRSLRARSFLLLLLFLIAAPALIVFTARYLEFGWQGVVASHSFDAWTHMWEMSPLTVLLFIILGASASVSPARGAGKRSAAAAWGAAIVAATAAVVSIGYFYREPLFYGGNFIPVAATTAACVFILSFTFLAEAGQGLRPWNFFQGDSPRAMMIRSFLPLTVGTVLALGFVDARTDISHSVLYSVIFLIGALLCTALLVARISSRVAADIVLGERRLKGREDEFRRMFELSSFGELLTALDGRMIEINNSFSRMLGYTKENLALMRFSEVTHPDDVATSKECVRALLAGEREACRIEKRYIRKDGSVMWADVGVMLLRDENGAPLHFHATIVDITGSRLASEAVSASEVRYRRLFEAARDGILILDAETGDIADVNPFLVELLGLTREQFLGKKVWEIGTFKDVFANQAKFLELQKRGYVRYDNLPLLTAAGRKVQVEFISNVYLVNLRRVIQCNIRDITEHKKLEAQLEQSQKMECVGRLAGGVAHDFNNILTAINGFTGFAMTGLPEGDQRLTDLKEVLAASDRAVRLTRQLLAFSRKQILNPEILDINSAVGGIVNMLKRIIGEDVKLETRLAAQPCPVMVDAGQIEQVFLNLAVNARDAMPKGGTLIFETGLMSPTEDFSSSHPDLPRGPLVSLSVRDTGLGMSDETRRRLFEPFFTTKEKGQGTGLGLSMVYGIIKQSGGDIEVESAPDRGTVFRIYFPCLPALAPARKKTESADASPRGNETVLLVEDEDSIRRLAARILSAKGYSVLSAADGNEALKVLERHGGAVDLLITDVVMPGMSGRELAQEIASRNLAHRTLFISGFTDDAIVKHGVLDAGLAFMYKPFSPDALLRKIREVLDGPADRAKA